MKSQYLGNKTTLDRTGLTPEQKRAERNRKQRERYATDPEFRARAIAAVKAWDAKNPDKVAVHKANYRKNNRDKILANQAAWRAANPEKVAENARKWRLNNPEQFKASQAAWRAANPEKVKASSRRAALARNLGKQTDDGHIYVFKTNAEGPYKIGYTGRDVKYRKYEAQRDNFNKVEVVYQSGFIPNARQLEAELHEQFKGKNVRGEWYDLNKTNIKNIKTFVNKKVTK